MFGIPSLSTVALGAGLGAAALVGTFGAGAVFQSRKDAVADLKAQIAVLQFDVAESQKKEADAVAEAALIEAASNTNEESIDADAAGFSIAYGCILPAELEWLHTVGAAGPRKGSLPTPGILAASARSRDPGCDSWPIVAAKYKARLLKANDIIARGRGSWQRMVADYAKAGK